MSLDKHICIYTYTHNYHHIPLMSKSSLVINPSQSPPSGNHQLTLSVQMSFTCCKASSKLHTHTHVRMYVCTVCTHLCLAFCSPVSENHPCCASQQFLNFIAQLYSIVWIYHNLSIHSSVEHLNCFQLSAILYKAAMNVCMHVFLFSMVFLNIHFVDYTYLFLFCFLKKSLYKTGIIS